MHVRRIIRFVGKSSTPWAKAKVRHLRVRQKVDGTTDRPRLVVFRSARHIYAQVIDDTKGHTLAAASDLEKEIRDFGENLQKKEKASKVGTLVARRARNNGVSKVVFDRGGYPYQGRINALADAAREEGLGF